MIKKYTHKLAIIASLIALCFTCISCNSSDNDESGDKKEFLFATAIIPIKMQLPNGWQTETLGKWNENWFGNYPEGKYIGSVSITSNPLKSSLQSDKGVIISFLAPYYLGDNSIDSFPEIEQRTVYKLGKNTLYLSNPVKSAVLSINNEYAIPIDIEKWPTKGITPELESFLSSIKIH